MREIQQTHTQKSVGQQTHVAWQAFIAQAPHHAKNQQRDGDRQNLQPCVQRQIGSQATYQGLGRHHHHQQQHQHPQGHRAQGTSCFRLVTGVNLHGAWCGL